MRRSLLANSLAAGLYFLGWWQSTTTVVSGLQLSGRSSNLTSDIAASPSLQQEQLQACSYEVVMFDTRSLDDIPSFEGKLIPDQYWSLTAVLNYAYAKKYGYRFRFVHVDESKMLSDYNVAWHRVFYFNNRLQEMSTSAKQEGDCEWLVYLDTDAFFRGFDTSLPSFINRMASTYRIQDDVGAIFAQEQVDPPMMPKTWHAINAGVYLVRSDAQSRYLFNTWQSAAGDDEQLKKKWPAEQGVLTELYFHGKYYTKLGKQHAQLRKHGDIQSAIALVNMTEMNSPWGRFIEHVWSGPGYEKRDTDFTAMLARIGAAEPKHFQQLLDEVRTSHTVEWAATRG